MDCNKRAWRHKEQQHQRAKHIKKVYHISALEIAARFWKIDPTLAADLINKINDPMHLAHIVQCAQSKLKAKTNKP